MLKKTLTNKNVIFLDDSDEGSKDGSTAGLIKDCDWRLNKRDTDDVSTLEKLSDHAPEYERQLWNKRCINNSKLKPKSNNFEDIYTYYEVLGDELSRISPNSDVEASYNVRSAEYHRQALVFHQDTTVNESSEEQIYFHYGITLVHLIRSSL